MYPLQARTGNTTGLKPCASCQLGQGLSRNDQKAPARGQTSCERRPCAAPSRHDVRSLSPENRWIR